jgi:hypothetical protein
VELLIEMSHLEVEHIFIAQGMSHIVLAGG